MDFGEVLAALKAGQACARRGWHGEDMCIALMQPKVGSGVTLPFILFCTPEGDVVPWVASQTDLLAEDWEVVD